MRFVYFLLFLGGHRLSGDCVAAENLREGEDGIEDADNQSWPEFDGVSEDAEPSQAAADALWEHNVKSVAKKLSLTTDEAADLLMQQGAFEVLIQQVEDDAAFLQATMPLHPNDDLVLHYKDGDVPQESRERIQKHVATEEYGNVTIVPSKLSRADAKDRRRRLVGKLWAKGYEQIYTSIYADEFEIHLANPQGEANPQGGARRLETGETGEVHAALVAEILDLDHDHADLDGVKLFYTERNVADDEHKLDYSYGGTKMYNKDDPDNSVCTAGWSIRIPSNPWGKRYGLLTAGHCVIKYNLNRVHNQKTDWDEKIYAMDAHLEGEGGGDMGWYQTKYLTEPELITEFGTVPVTGIQVPETGIDVPRKNKLVCSHSRELGGREGWTKCGQVVTKDDAHNVIRLKRVLEDGMPNPYQYYNVTGLAVTDTESMKDGDSGGPYFIQSCKGCSVKASGVHHARLGRLCENWYPIRDCNMYSSMKELYNLYGVELAVSSGGSIRIPFPNTRSSVQGRGDSRGDHVSNYRSNPDDDDGDGVACPVDDCFRRCEGKYGGDYTKGDAYYCSKGCARMRKGAVTDPTKWCDKAPSVIFDKCISGCDDSSSKSSRRKMCKYGCEFWCPHDCILRCSAKHDGNILGKFSGDVYSCAKGCAGMSGGEITNPGKYCKKDEDDRYDECKDDCKSASSNTEKQDMCKYGCEYWDT